MSRSLNQWACDWSSGCNQPAAASAQKKAQAWGLAGTNLLGLAALPHFHCEWQSVKVSRSLAQADQDLGPRQIDGLCGIFS